VRRGAALGLALCLSATLAGARGVSHALALPEPSPTVKGQEPVSAESSLATRAHRPTELPFEDGAPRERCEPSLATRAHRPSERPPTENGAPRESSLAPPSANGQQPSDGPLPETGARRESSVTPPTAQGQRPSDGPLPETGAQRESSATQGQRPTDGPLPETGESARAAALWGTWEWAGDAAERAAIEAAIARSTDGLFFIVKAIARGRLRERSAIPQRYTLALAGEAITSDSTGNLLMRSPADGGSAAYRSSLGEDVALRQQLREGALVQVLAADGGVRTNTFTLGPDGQTLWLRVVVASDSLARPLDYRLTYRRVR
jgi:hypothetical protein